MFQARQVATIGKEPVDVLGHRIVFWGLPKAIKLRDYSGKLLVDRQREAPELWRQELFASGMLADGRRRKKALIRLVGALQVRQAPLVLRGLSDLVYETRSVRPV